MLLVVAAVVICIYLALVSFKNYLDKRKNTSLYFGITMLLWAACGIFMSLINPGLSETLVMTYFKLFATSGLLSFIFLIMFVASIAHRENVVEYGLFVLGFVFCAIYAVWTSSTFVEAPALIFERVYSEPIGVPITEFISIVGIGCLLYASWVLFSTSEIVEKKSTKAKSLLTGIGLLVLSISFPVLLTNALPTLYLIFADMWAISILVISAAYLIPQEVLDENS